MRTEFPPEGESIDPSWWAPLETVARTIAGDRRYRFFDLADFMIAFKVIRKPRPDVIVYEHRHTRHELTLDQSGHAYRFIASRPGTRSLGRFVLHRSLRIALDELDLWELPWMKDGLEEFRFGLGWDNRLLLHPDYPEWMEEDEARLRRSRLRLVRWRPITW